MVSAHIFEHTSIVESVVVDIAGVLDSRVKVTGINCGTLWSTINVGLIVTSYCVGISLPDPSYGISHSDGYAIRREDILRVWSYSYSNGQSHRQTSKKEQTEQ